MSFKENIQSSKSGSTPKEEPAAFIPYGETGSDFDAVPIYLRADCHYYQSRMGFFPNALKLYLHRPWIAEHIIKLNNAIMRDERNSLDEHLKYRLAMVISQANECAYCTSHHAGTLTGRYGYEEDGVESLLTGEQAEDEKEVSKAEQVATEFVREASLDPESVTDEMRAELAEHFTPQEVMEIITLLGFWNMYNTMHAAMALPIEQEMDGFSKWVEVGPSS